MDFTPRFKSVWWLILVIGLSWYLFIRLDELKAGRSATIDVFVFLVWAALLLSPLFNEVNFFGILNLKQEIEETRRQLLAQFSSVESRINNSVAFSPHINVSPSIPDSQLPQLRTVIEKILEEKDLAQTVKKASGWEPAAADEDVEFLFRTRLNIESELRRIYRELLSTDAPKRSGPSLLTDLTQFGIISGGFAFAIRQIYTVCTPAIHGEKPTREQIQFVRDTAPLVMVGLQNTRIVR